MQKLTIETLDLEKLSIPARDLILELLYRDFDLHQIKLAMEDGEYLRKAGISEKISEEVHSFLCKENKCADNTEANNAAEESESNKKEETNNGLR